MYSPSKDPMRMFGQDFELEKAEIAKLQNTIAEYRANLKQMTEIAERNYAQARKYRKKYKAMSSELAAAAEHTNEIQTERDKLAREAASTVEDVKLLKLQLQAAHATHLEAQTAWNVLQAKTKQMEGTIETLNEQLENQRQEIAELSQVRTKCLNLIEILHRALCQSESKITELLAENQKKKSLELNRPEPKFKLTDCLLPFKGDLGQRIDSIWKDETLDQKQRLQIGMNEISSFIEDIQIKSHSKSSDDEKEIERLKLENAKYLETLATLTGSLKQLATGEETVSNKAFYSGDSCLLHFLARNCFDVEHGGGCLSNTLGSFAILAADGQYQRIEVVKEISALGAHAEAFIAGLLIVNHFMSRQVNKLSASLEHKTEIEEAMKDIGVENPSEFPVRMDEIRSEVSRILEYKKQIKVAARELQEELEDKESKLSDAMARLEDMISENEHLRSEIQVLSNKAVLNTSGSTSLSTSSISQERTGVFEGKIKALENQVIEKEKELYSLREMHLKSTREAEISVQELTQRAQELTVKLEAMQDAYQQLRMRDLSSKDRYKKKVHALTKQHAREMNEQKMKLEDTQQTLSTANSALQDRVNQTNVLSKKLADSLAESERRNQVLNEEVSRLTISKQKLEARLKAIEDRNDKERQMCQVQATARILAAETRLHESSAKEKSSLLKEINQLTGYIADELGTFYGLNGAALDTETCHQLLVRAKADLSRAACV